MASRIPQNTTKIILTIIESYYAENSSNLEANQKQKIEKAINLLKKQLENPKGKKTTKVPTEVVKESAAQKTTKKGVGDFLKGVMGRYLEHEAIKTMIEIIIDSLS